jgi:hypothetical protein
MTPTEAPPSTPQRPDELPALPLQVGPLGVGLRAHRQVLARRHGHGTGHQPGDPGDEDRRAEPADALAAPLLSMARRQTFRMVEDTVFPRGGAGVPRDAPTA